MDSPARGGPTSPVTPTITSEVQAAAEAVRTLVRLISATAPPQPGHLAGAVPGLTAAEVGIVLRHLRALGWIESPRATSADLEHAEAAEALARGAEPRHPLDRDQRRTAELAAACLIALRDTEHLGSPEPAR